MLRSISAYRSTVLVMPGSFRSKDCNVVAADKDGTLIPETARDDLLTPNSLR